MLSVCAHIQSLVYQHAYTQQKQRGQADPVFNQYRRPKNGYADSNQKKRAATDGCQNQKPYQAWDIHFGLFRKR